jgi:hypothetical protein
MGELQSRRERWTLGPAEYLAVQFFIQLNARFAGGLAIRHAEQGCVNGRGNAASGAMGGGSSWQSTKSQI